MDSIETVEKRNEAESLEKSMTFEEFQRSVSGEAPPPKLTPALTALWWDAKGSWQSAHSFAQDDEGPEGAWVHAYLHRKEGDRGNAGYWYRRAGKSFCDKSLPEEWLSILRELLGE